nr:MULTISPECIES: DNA translocase FtsK [Bacillaceae]
MDRFKRMYTYFKEWIFPKDEMENQTNRQQNRSTTYSNKLYNNMVGAKVIHQYPKSNNFPFPAVRDDEPLGELVERNRKRKSEKKQTLEPDKPTIKTDKVVNINQNKQSEERTQFFQGTQFSYQKSPSPIYGYRIKNDNDENNEEIKEEQATILETLKPVEKEEGAFQVNYMEDDNDEHETKTESVALGSENDEITKPLSIVNEKNTVDNSPIERIPSSINTKDKQTEEVKAFEIQTRKVEEGRTSSDRKVVEGSNIPFNVMMFKRDRIKESKKRVEQEKNYAYPTLHLLDIPPRNDSSDKEWLTKQINKLDETFRYFNIGANVVNVTEGPTVTRFEVQPEPGVKVSKITNLSDDIKLALAAKDIRIEAPIPGKNTIGIEVPNNDPKPVLLRETLRHSSFQQGSSPLTVGLGMDITGTPVVTDLQKMPHGLIAGATGSGKSVCVNSILVSLLYKASPEEVRLLLIDPKVVELAPYNDIPHLACPVITDPKEATEGLKWAVLEMERRYELFAEHGTRDLKRFNHKMKEEGKKELVLPYIVVVVDELADLMMVAPHDVEEAICRIAQKARACGIHLLVATQRPSVDVITGLIKANIPTRIAFSVSAQADSRTILDGGGAERLLGKGDMLFLENGSGKPVRIQGTFVSDDEIDRVMSHVKKIDKPAFLFEKETLLQQVDGEAEDELFERACEFVYEHQAASASLLQRHFRIGYNRAARMIDEMEMRGIISEARGSKPREVYLTKEEINERIR